jgi:hypothetical protein
MRNCASELKAGTTWMGHRKHTFAISRLDTPELCQKFPCPRKQRAQGMPHARCTRGLVCMRGAIERKTKRRTIMPNWLGPLLALSALVGFIGFAFRQGTKVKPDKDGNPDNSVGGGGGDVSHGGSDGH